MPYVDIIGRSSPGYRVAMVTSLLKRDMYRSRAPNGIVCLRFCGFLTWDGRSGGRHACILCYAVVCPLDSLVGEVWLEQAAG